MGPFGAHLQRPTELEVGGKGKRRPRGRGRCRALAPQHHDKVPGATNLDSLGHHPRMDMAGRLGDGFMDGGKQAQLVSMPGTLAASRARCPRAQRQDTALSWLSGARPAKLAS